jgi:hypothetical protein
MAVEYYQGGKMVRQLTGLISASVFAMTLAAGPAAAQNPHFVVGPTLEDQGTTLQATGAVAGLGNEDIDVILSARGVASITCTNPAGNVAPGQDKTLTVTGTETDVEVKNGRASFDVTTDAASVDLSGSCPNRRWTAQITDIDFTSATLTIVQGGDTVLQRTFTL